MVNFLLSQLVLLNLTVLSIFGTSSVTVDDGDTSIIYTGTWKEDNFTDALDRTLRYSRVPGSTATYKFKGSKIQVYGALGPPRGPAFQVSASFDVGEGQDIQFYNNSGPPAKYVYKLLYYTSPTLSMGEHTLIITNNADYLWLDYFVYDVAEVTSSTTQPTFTSPPSSATSPAQSVPPLATALPPDGPQNTPTATVAILSPQGSSGTATVAILSPQGSSGTSSSPASPLTVPVHLSGLSPSTQSQTTSTRILDPSTATSSGFETSALMPPTSVQGQVTTGPAADTDSRLKMSTTAIAGIVAGCIASLLVSMIVFIMMRRRKGFRKSQSSLALQPHFPPATTSEYPTSRRFTASYRDEPATAELSSEMEPSSSSPFSPQDNSPQDSGLLKLSQELSASTGQSVNTCMIPRREEDGGVRLRIVGPSAMVAIEDTETEPGLDYGGTLPPAYDDMYAVTEPNRALTWCSTQRSSDMEGTWVFHPAPRPPQ